MMADDGVYCDTSLTPPSTWFAKQGFGGMVRMVYAKHFPAEHGGWSRFIELCGRGPLTSGPSHKHAQLAESQLRAYLASSQLPDVMPSMAELESAEANSTHPLHHHAKGLPTAIKLSSQCLIIQFSC